MTYPFYNNNLTPAQKMIIKRKKDNEKLLRESTDKKKNHKENLTNEKVETPTEVEVGST